MINNVINKKIGADINKIGNENREVITNTTEIQRTIRKYNK